MSVVPGTAEPDCWDPGCPASLSWIVLVGGVRPGRDVTVIGPVCVARLRIPKNGLAGIPWREVPTESSGRVRDIIGLDIVVDGDKIDEVRCGW